MNSEFQTAIDALGASIDAAEDNHSLAERIGAIRNKLLGYGSLYRPHQNAIADLLIMIHDGAYGQCSVAESHLNAAYAAFERAFAANNSLQGRRP